MLALFATACQGPTSKYLLDGIGAELSAPDIAHSTNLQIKYFNYICQQAGLSIDPTNEKTYCKLPSSDQASWTLVVQQGMNDIDRRCDAYLQWLDNRKRSKAPLLRQLGSTKTVVSEVIQITVPTAATALKSISIVGLAFQLLSDSIENYHSRLLLEIDTSTVNSIVQKGRYDFRKHIRDEKIVFRSKPEAEHALRSYMRLCLPFAIEAKINDFSTLGASGLTLSQASDRPVVGTALSASIPRDGAESPAKPTPPLPPKNKFLTQSIRLTKDEEAMNGTSKPSEIQRSLCVTPDDGVFGNGTRLAIAMAKQGLRHSNAAIPGIQSDVTDTLNSTMIDFFFKQSSCVNHDRGYMNAFEKYAFPDAALVGDLQRSLRNCAAILKASESGASVTSDLDGVLTISNVFDDATRTTIKTVRAGLKSKGKLRDGISSSVTEELKVQLSPCLDL